MRSVILYMLSTSAVLADCPLARDTTSEISAVLFQVQKAESEAAARQGLTQLWEIWTRAPDGAAQELLDRGMEARSVGDFRAALAALDRLVAYCPDYAEGYNQRAFVNFLRQNFGPALDDLNQTLKLSHNHVAAMSGKALTLIGMGRHGEAELVLREALALNPWLPERHLLPEFQGQDL